MGLIFMNMSNNKDDKFSNRIGKFKNVKVKLHIDQNVISAAQPEQTYSQGWK